jgi:hypothetical protein
MKMTNLRISVAPEAAENALFHEVISSQLKNANLSNSYNNQIGSTNALRKSSLSVTLGAFHRPGIYV